MSTPVYNVYFVAGNVDPTPPRPRKAPAKPAVRLALAPHTTSAIPVAAPAAIPGTISVPRRPSTIQPAVPVGADDDKQERRTTSHPEQDVVIEHPITVTIIVITILQGPLRDLKEVGQLEQLVLFLKLSVRHQVNGTFILVFGTRMLETFLPERMFLLPGFPLLLP